MSELHRVFEDNPQIMDYILDDDSKTNIPPIPTIFVNVNHAIDEIGFIPFVARFQQERLFSTSLKEEAVVYEIQFVVDRGFILFY